MDILATLLVLSAASTQISEELFGAFISGPTMKLVSILVGIAVTFGIQTLSFYGALDNYDPLQTAVLGIVVGLGSSVVHALFEKIAPGYNKTTLGSIVKKK